MGEPRVCFDASIYSKAVLSVGLDLGITTGSYDVGSVGELWCSDEYAGEVLVRSQDGSVLNDPSIFRDNRGNIFRRKKLNEEQNRNIMAFLGQDVTPKSEEEALVFRSVRTYYQCISTNDPVCMDKAKEAALTSKKQLDEMEQQRMIAAQDAQLAKERGEVAKMITDGRAIWERVFEFLRAAEKEEVRCVKISSPLLESMARDSWRSAPDVETATRAEAEAYLDNAKNVLADLVTTSEGATLINVRGELAQCTVKRSKADQAEVFCAGISIAAEPVVVYKECCDPVQVALR